MRNPYDDRTRVKYVVCESPAKPGEEKKPYPHVRVVSKGTMRLNRIIKELSAYSSFSSSDIKGVLDGFINQIVSHLEDGYEVDFEGLGHFSTSLHCAKKMNPDKITADDIAFKTVKFRCSKEIRKRLSGMCFERVPKKEQYAGLPEATRKKRILSLFDKYTTIQSGDCMAVNGCSRYTAQKDLKELKQEGKIIQLGYYRSVMFALPE